MNSSRRRVQLLAVALSFIAAGCGASVDANGGTSTTAGVWAPTTVANAPGVEGVQSGAPVASVPSAEVTAGPATTPATVPVAAPVSLSAFEWSSPYELFSNRGDNTCLPQQKVMSTNLGALQRVLDCYKDWAVGVTERLHDSMGGSTDYPQESVYHRAANGKWSIVASCAPSQPLLDFRACAEYQDRTIGTPEPSVLCRIWATNTLVAHIDLTRCTPDKQDVARAVSEPCASFTNYATENGMLTAVGFGKCNQGALVCVVQGQLASAGYSVSVDGRLDLATLHALMDYQRVNDLIPSGSIRPAKWSELFPSVPMTVGAPAGCPFTA